MLIADLEWWLGARGVLETELQERPHTTERTRTTRTVRADRRQHEDYSDDDSDNDNDL